MAKSMLKQGLLVKRKNSQHEGVNAGYEVLNQPVLSDDIQQGLTGHSLALALKWTEWYLPTHIEQALPMYCQQKENKTVALQTWTNI